MVVDVDTFPAQHVRTPRAKTGPELPGLGDSTALPASKVDIEKEREELSQLKKLMDGDKCRLNAILSAIDELGFELSRQGKVIRIWAGENTRTFRSAEFAVGKSIGAYFGEKAFRDMRPVIARVMESGKGESMVHTQNLKGGTKWYKSRLSPIKSSDGRIQNICLFARDITESQMLHGKLADAEKMEAVGHLSGEITHDFNNILGVIQGAGELLSANLGSAHPQHKYVAQLLRSTESAAILTKRFLAFSRQQAREPRITDLNEIVSDVEQLVHRIVGDVEIRTILEPNLYGVRGDPHEIQRVIMNLVNNARDASPNGGIISIETSNAILSESQLHGRTNALPGKYAVLTVKDAGIGMDSATLLHIFEPFFTTKKNGRGTGLGLASVYTIVNRCQGFIEVSSELAKGACFHIYLPATSCGAGVSSPTSLLSAGRTGSETVLLVEDSKELRSVLKEMLETAGHSVIEASTAEEALLLATLHVKPVDLLITDIVTRGFGGHHLARHLKKICPKVRVLYMTGYTGIRLKERGDTTPSRYILRKPFTRSVFLERVAASLRSPVLSKNPQHQMDSENFNDEAPSGV